MIALVRPQIGLQGQIKIDAERRQVQCGRQPLAVVFVEGVEQFDNSGDALGNVVAGGMVIS